MNLFAKARAGLSLTPAQRAILKLTEALAVAGLVAALPVVADALSTHGTIVWADVLHTGLATGAVAILLAAVKYLKAQGDSPLADAAANALEQVAGKVATDNGVASASVPATSTPTSAPTSAPESDTPPAGNV